jgi:hypothetical protein
VSATVKVFENSRVQHMNLQDFYQKIAKDFVRMRAEGYENA